MVALLEIIPEVAELDFLANIPLQTQLTNSKFICGTCLYKVLSKLKMFMLN